MATFCLIARRSHRTKVAPLQFWKNEKLVYGKPDDEGIVGQVIKAVIRAQPEEIPRKPKSGSKRKDAPQSIARPPPSRRRRIDPSPDKDDIVEQGEESDVHTEEEDRRAMARRGLREEAKFSAETVVYGSDNVVSRGRDPWRVKDFIYCFFCGESARNISLISICLLFAIVVLMS